MWRPSLKTKYLVCNSCSQHIASHCQSTKSGYVNISKLIFFPVNRTFLNINVPGIHSSKSTQEGKDYVHDSRDVCLMFQAPRKTQKKSPDPTRVTHLARNENRGSVDKEKVITAPQMNPSRNQSQKNLGPLSPGNQPQPHLPLAAFCMAPTPPLRNGLDSALSASSLVPPTQLRAAVCVFGLSL